MTKSTAANQKGKAKDMSKSQPAQAGPKTRAKEPADWKVPMVRPRLPSEEAVARSGRGEAVADELLGVAVDLGDDIHR